MKTERIKVGDRVEKTGSLTDYVTGRQGEIVEMDYDAERARVRWDMSPSYRTEGTKAVRTGEVSPMKPIKTWVNFRYLSDPIN
jgi:hypothetical protein